MGLMFFENVFFEKAILIKYIFERPLFFFERIISKMSFLRAILKMYFWSKQFWKGFFKICFFLSEKGILKMYFLREQFLKSIFWESNFENGHFMGATPKIFFEEAVLKMYFFEKKDKKEIKKKLENRRN